MVALKHADSHLNLQAEPDENAAVIGRADAGSMLIVRGEAENGWIPVRALSAEAWARAGRRSLGARGIPADGVTRDCRAANGRVRGNARAGRGSLGERGIPADGVACACRVRDYLRME